MVNFVGLDLAFADQVALVPTTTKEDGPDRRYWARTRDMASHDPIPIPLGYRGHCKAGLQRYWARTHDTPATSSLP
ncbi:hypothetical protein TNCV_2674621 [Trichonephila clavipes]|nr:hypothetical protein TNCV_2674621 [Trichonephila clavipes]